MMKMPSEQYHCKLSDEEVAVYAKKYVNAANHLVARNRNYVYKCASSFFIKGGDYEDIVQEGMIGLSKAILDFDPALNKSFSSFAAVCIKRQLITAVKASNRKKHLPLNTYISLSSFASDSESVAPKNSEPLSVVLDKEYKKRVSVKIGKLLSDFELEVLLGYLDGKTYKDISASVGKDAKAVDNAISRIKKKLFFLLNKDDE